MADDDDFDPFAPYTPTKQDILNLCLYGAAVIADEEGQVLHVEEMEAMFGRWLAVRDAEKDRRIAELEKYQVAHADLYRRYLELLVVVRDVLSDSMNEYDRIPRWASERLRRAITEKEVSDGKGS